MIEIDGSEGEGGGQVLRTALALSCCTGEAFAIRNIRANRGKPGLMRQHLTAVNAAAAISGAEVGGAAIGSSAIEFRPGSVRTGEYRFAIGTSGSTTLVLQTILPPLMTATGPSKVILEGGTHNPLAPPFDFVLRAFLPVVGRMGPKVALELERPGFHPAGGGRLGVSIAPSPRLAAFELVDRGGVSETWAEAIFAGIPFDVAKRELAVVARELGWTDGQLRPRELPAEYGPGNVLLLNLAFANVTEVFCAFGRRGVTSEAVAGEVVARARGFLETSAAVGPYLADQLLLPLALAGEGSFTTVKPSAHARTNAAVIERFLPVKIAFEQESGGRWLANVRRR